MALTRQLFSQVLVVLVAETVRADQSTSLGVACSHLSMPCFSFPVLRAYGSYRCTTSRGLALATKFGVLRVGVGGVPASGGHIPARSQQPFSPHYLRARSRTLKPILRKLRSVRRMVDMATVARVLAQSLLVAMLKSQTSNGGAAGDARIKSLRIRSRLSTCPF